MIQQPKYARLIRAALLPLLLTLAGCASFQSLQYRGIEDWNLSPSSLTHSTLSARVAVYNPNGYDLKIQRVQADILVDGDSWGTYAVDSLMVLPAKSVYELPVRLQVRNGQLLAKGLSLASGGSLPYLLKGRVRGGRGKLIREVPFEYAGQFSGNDLRL